MKVLNIGILAHVDAGKTTLTEQLLYKAGIIAKPGSVDRGNTTTDSLEIEQRRGISVKSAAVSFAVGDLKVNLIDTPGHADFISEVEHSLSVMDGAILVISAVEGIQSQTKILMQTLKEHRIPTIIFVNKIDRMGADYKKVSATIKMMLTECVCELNEVINEGTSDVVIGSINPEIANWIDVLTLHDEELLTDFANGENISNERLKHELREQAKQGLVYPIFVGAAAKGIGIKQLLETLDYYFPVNCTLELNTRPLSGVVYKINKNVLGMREVFVRIFEGQLNIREEVSVISQSGEVSSIKLRQLSGLKNGQHIVVNYVEAGDMAILSGAELKVGDIIGELSSKIKVFELHNPPLQVQVLTEDGADEMLLHQALTDLTSENPFLQYFYDRENKESIVHIFGKVQQEILIEIINKQYGIKIKFSSPKINCVERPCGTGGAVEYMCKKGNPFWATVGFRIESGREGSGLQYRLEVELGSLPLSFQKAIKETVFEVLKEGLYGWEVTDIIVTLTHTGFDVPSVAKDFRSLVPLVLMEALNKAKTNVYEPVNSINLTIPEYSLSKILSRLSILEGVFEEPIFKQMFVELNGTIPVRQFDCFESELQSITSGEGTLFVKQGGYLKVARDIPENTRRKPNPLNRGEYFLYLNKVM